MLKRIAINAFLVFHIVAITCWCVPLNSLLPARVKEAVRPYMLWTGLFQAWDMFAPEPPMLSIYLEAEITFRNGQTRVWKFPKMQELGYAERYYKERYRKFANERLRLDDNARLWPDAARYIARLNHDPANPPATVQLARYWRDLAPEGWRGLEPLHSFRFYTYRVQPGDLP
jgi:hypothetical protein